MEANKSIKVEVAYAASDQQHLESLQLPNGATVEQAIDQSRLLSQFPEIDLSSQKVGIYSKVCQLDTVLKSGDRVEIYRPLQLNPMDARRKRATESHSAKK